MRVETFNRFVQISIEEQNELLPKFVRYATKYFQNYYRLSSSVLILDDGERFKKDYLINWAYYSAMQSQNADAAGEASNAALEAILEQSYLPIRIKIIGANALLECVKVSFRLLGFERAVIILDRPNHIAKRYISALLAPIVLSSDLSHIYLDAKAPNFWGFVLNLIGNRIIHNVRLEFDYDTFRGLGKGFGGRGNGRGGFGGERKSFRASYLTEREVQLLRAYETLGCAESEDFFSVKSRYLTLAKEYHPDNVFGQDSHTIEAYSARFIELKEAFDIIKAGFEATQI